MQETWEMQVPSLGQEHPLKEGMATHSSILPWSILWTEEPGGLQPTGSQRVGCDWSDLAHTWCSQQSGLLSSITHTNYLILDLGTLLNSFPPLPLPSFNTLHSYTYQKGRGSKWTEIKLRNPDHTINSISSIRTAKHECLWWLGKIQ